jgi:sugar phosphate isomerase/epimerase
MENTHNIDLHAVFTEVSDTNDLFLQQNGFEKHTIESEDIETRLVYTFKPDQFLTKPEFNNKFEEVKSTVFGINNGIGYLEMETILYTKFIIEMKEYREIISPLNLKVYDPQPVTGDKFKRSDIHFRADEIAKEQINILSQMGFYMARFTDKIPTKGKSNHDVYTLQFRDTRLAEQVFRQVENLLKTNGGFAGKMQIEPTLRYFRTPNYPVPPCVR